MRLMDLLAKPSVVEAGDKDGDLGFAHPASGAWLSLDKALEAKGRTLPDEWKDIGRDGFLFDLRKFDGDPVKALPIAPATQAREGTEVAMSDLAPGDLLFWAYDTGNPARIHHVALYLGDGLMVHSPHTGDHVRVATVYTNGLIGAVRPG